MCRGSVQRGEVTAQEQTLCPDGSDPTGDTGNRDMRRQRYGEMIGALGAGAAADSCSVRGDSRSVVMTALL